MGWNFNMQEAPGDGSPIVGINKNGQVRRIEYTTYHPDSVGYKEGKRRYWWGYVDDRDYTTEFDPVAWIHLPKGI